MCVIYAHQLRHRQLRLGRLRRLRLLLDALLCRRHLRLGGLQAKQIAESQRQQQHGEIYYTAREMQCSSSW
eukprot:COSAG06_NODE_8339_length_2199_cov_5.181429_2_plen_71_part_00